MQYDQPMSDQALPDPVSKHRHYADTARQLIPVKLMLCRTKAIEVV